MALLHRMDTPNPAGDPSARATSSEHDATVATVQDAAGAAAQDDDASGVHDEDATGPHDDDAADEDATADLVALLHDRGQRVTSQRLVILRELRRRARHATVEEIHASVRDELPGISVPTVYAVAELLVELGLVRKLDVGVGCWLYDARTRAHQHAVCRECGAVEDLDVAIDAEALLAGARHVGFAPERAEAVVHGLCAACAARAKPGY
jgi:Fe2+ or Zn2+ uptake regulation protein